jgi:hypothetical protein
VIRRKISILARVGILLAVSLTAMPSALAESWTDTNGCTGNVQDPHIATKTPGHNGKIDVTATIKCSNGNVATVDISSGTGGLYLFACPNKPPEGFSEVYLNGQCLLMGENHNSITDPFAGKKYSRTAPGINQPGASGVGYWAACLSWESWTDGGTHAVSPYVFSTHTPFLVA